MINVGSWRWPLVVGLPLVTGGALVGTGIVRPVFESRTVLAYSGKAEQVGAELKLFQTPPVQKASFEQVRGQPAHVSIRYQADWPSHAASDLAHIAQNSIDRSFTKQKNDLLALENLDQKQAADLGAQMERLMTQRKNIMAGPKRNSSRAQIVAKIEALKARRRQLIENYPSHSDIPVLAKQIQALLKQLDAPAPRAAGKLSDFDRAINETKLRRDYFARQAKGIDQTLKKLQPAWKTFSPMASPVWPRRVNGWSIGAGAMAGLFILGFVLLKDKRSALASRFDDLLKPQDTEMPVAEEAKSEELKADPPAAALEVISSEVPSDPLTEKAAGLYAKWVELSRLLYTPAPEPPQGVLDQVAPLLQESSEFLPEGHEVLAKYLARRVTPGDLASHVARTVLMTLTGAEEAGVSPEHRLAMALAALFHDLAVVPRPESAQEQAGSEVGRLSAAVLPRIPGLPDALLAMVEDILIGMDEFKLETWQNVANGKVLEPLSKVLREIDRFEKIMQKQRTRLDKRIANS